MIFSWNDYSYIKNPTITLSYPDKRQLSCISYNNLQGDFLFNGISEVTFEVYKYEDGELNDFYSNIEQMMLVLIDLVGWFQITSCPVENDGLNEKKTITAKSLENEFTTKIVTSFGELGENDDEQGGLDMYYLYRPDDKEHSVLHIAQSKCPAWKIGYIDPDITEQPRSINEDSISVYNLLVEKASELYDCVFQFDTFKQTINVYSLKNIGKVTNIYLSFQNLIEKLNIDSNFEDIKTVLYVNGGNDENTGSNIDIISVNPAGTNYICNFDYYKKMMSESLLSALNKYEEDYQKALLPYQSALNELNLLYDEYYNLQNKVPDEISDATLEKLITYINDYETMPSNINTLISLIEWDDYGSVELQTFYDSFEQRLSLYVNAAKSTDKERYDKNYIVWVNVRQHLNERLAEISEKETQIKEQQDIIRKLKVDINSYLTDDLQAELKRFWHEDTYTDDTCVVTTDMTDSEILDMKKDLLEFSSKELEKRSHPQFQIEIDNDNFMAVDSDYNDFKMQMALGNIMTIDFDDYCLELRLLKIHFNWNDETDFKMTFSNKSSLDDVIDIMAEIREQANASSNFIGINGVGVKSAKYTVSDFNKYKSSNLNAALQKLQAGDNYEFEINATGTKWRRWDTTANAYDPCQMWGTGNGLYLTQDGWKSLSMAIGKMEIDGDILYGIACDVLMGDITLTKHLEIINEDSTFIIGKNGFSATNGINTVEINPNSSKLFRILKGKEEKIYFDENGEACFAGKVIAQSGTIAGWVIDGSGLYYSDSTTKTGIGFWNKGMDGIAIHAGTDVTNVGGAPFRVYRDGTLVAKKATIDGTINATSGVFKNITITDGCTVTQNAAISARTWGSGFSWGGNVFGNSYIPDLTAKVFTSCSVPENSSFDIKGYSPLNIGGYQLGVVNYKPSSEWGFQLTCNSSSFRIYAGNHYTTFNSSGVTINGGLNVTGSKARAVRTDNYGMVKMSAFETSLPTFADYGRAILDNNGECYIYLDSIFLETIEINKAYTVFLTKYGLGDVYVSDRQKYFFVVKGTPNLEFSWEIRGTQRGIDAQRTENIETYFEPDIDYIQSADEYLKEIEKEIIDE